MYSLGKRSKDRLIGVHPDLVRVVKRAIGISEQDFSILQGIRTREQQAEYVRAGASQTMNSRHLKGTDGYGHAIDLGAWLVGEVRWEWALYPAIANAMRLAAIEEEVPVRWGGGWFLLNDITSPTTLARATRAYVDQRRSIGAKAFLDGPHFELPKCAGYP